jgi:hypothetical protein
VATNCDRPPLPVAHHGGESTDRGGPCRSLHTPPCLAVRTSQNTHAQAHTQARTNAPTQMHARAQMHAKLFQQGPLAVFLLPFLFTCLLSTRSEGVVLAHLVMQGASHSFEAELMGSGWCTTISTSRLQMKCSLLKARAVASDLCQA